MIGSGAGLALSLCGVLGGCASTGTQAERPEPPTLMEWEDFSPATAEGVWIAGQPSEAALDRFAEASAGRGGLVVNLRTDGEMAYLPYYGRSVAARGLRYIRIPTKGSELDAGEVDAFGEAVRGYGGPVLLHCASGGRATYLWAMRRMAEEGISADEAIAWVEAERGGPVSERGEEILRGFARQTDEANPVTGDG
jgi:uncharacterized protein (TIGR01244 family)